MKTYTAGDQINRALRLLGILAEGETPSAETSDDALTALNQMIDSWSIERLSVFSTFEQVVIWPPGIGNQTQTLGPSGTLGAVIGTHQDVFFFETEDGETLHNDDGSPSVLNVSETPILAPMIRPILIDDSTYFVDPGSGISYGVKMINREQYNAIALKTATSTFPQVVFVNQSFPDVEMTIYPVPTRALEWHIVSVQPLSGPATLATPLRFPPGYLRAFTYNLALEIAPEFGVEPSPNVRNIAIISKRNIKRINNPGDLMSLPAALTRTGSRYNIYAGTP